VTAVRVKVSALKAAWENIRYKYKEKRMLNIETKTKLTADDVMKRATKYFKGFKMKALEETGTHAFFEGAGGSVELTVCPDKGITTVSFISREWDSPVKDFIESLPEKVKY
jgi:hypothetical protein